MSEETNTLVWESMLGSEYRARYFSDLSTRYRWWSSVLNVTLAILTSGAAVTLLIDIPLLAKFCSLVAAGLSWLIVVMDFSGMVRDSASFSRQWIEVQKDYKLLWAELDDLDPADVRKRWTAIEEKLSPLDELSTSKFPYERGLGEKVWRETLKARGLEGTAA